MARRLPLQNLLRQNVGSAIYSNLLNLLKLSATCCNLLKQPNGELLVAIEHRQWRHRGEIQLTDRFPTLIDSTP